MRKLYFILPAAAIALSANAADLQPATFEGLLEKPESYWYGDIEDKSYTTGSFRSGSFEFKNLYDQKFESWSFFAYANLTGNVYNSWQNKAEQMMNAVGGGHDSESYCMVYCDGYNGPTTVTIPDFAKEGVIVPGMWITNSAWVVSAIINGDGMSGPFEEGDLLCAVATATPIGASEPVTVKFPLADYTSKNADEHYYVSDWRWMDLSKLGAVNEITFTIETTKANSFGPTTPSYFAIDDLGVDGASAVESVSAEDYRVAAFGNLVTVNGKEDAFRVEAYTLDGRLAAAASATAGHAELTLPAGLYIIRHGATATKIRL